MDIMGNSHPQSQPVRTTDDQAAFGGNHGKKSKRKAVGGWFKLAQIVLLFAATVLVVALLFGIYEGGPSEQKYVNTSQFQAVFLNGGVGNGQVLYSTYFGHITALNNQFVVLQDVYYITTSSTTGASSNNVQLTKLGCQQLHAPYDQMIINKSQVSFWENLQASGQVVKAINSYQKANPNGPNCSQTSSSSTSTPSTTNSPAATDSTAANTTP
jgi:hypothetical protein